MFLSAPIFLCFVNLIPLSKKQTTSCLFNHHTLDNHYMYIKTGVENHSFQDFIFENKNYSTLIFRIHKRMSVRIRIAAEACYYKFEWTHNVNKLNKTNAYVTPGRWGPCFTWSRAVWGPASSPCLCPSRTEVSGRVSWVPC